MDLLRHSEILHTLIALSAVSLASVAGSVSFALGKRLNAVLPYLVSAASGALLGTALTHLIPEAIAQLGSGQTLGLLLLGGFVFSFLLERLLWVVFRRQDHGHENGWELPAGVTFHHGHEHERTSRKAIAGNILFSGGIHSFVDGVAIATSFAVGHKIGIATTIAVLIHEVPHHVADVGVLMYSGMTRGRAVLYNLLATSGCATGGLLILISGSRFEWLTAVLLPLSAANFLYIALAILMPELQKEPAGWRSAMQAFCLLGSAALISWLAKVA